VDGLLRFTAAIQDGVVNRNATLMYFVWTFGFVFQCLLQILTIITYLLCIWLSHLKQMMYEQIMWSIYVAWVKPFSGLPSHPNSVDNMHFSNNFSRCTMHSNKVVKLLQILRFWWRSLYVATVTLVFICGIETVHCFCTREPKPVLGYNIKLVWTNRLRP